MDTLFDKNIYKDLLDIIMEMVKAQDMDDMIIRLNRSIETVMPTTTVYAAIWDKYDEEIELFPKKAAGTSESAVKELFCHFLKSDTTQFSGKMSDLDIKIKKNSIKASGIFYSMKRMEKGIRGAVIGFHDTDLELQKTEVISKTILPQFWDIFSQRYLKMVTGKETEMLWKMKDLQSETTGRYLNNIELNKLLENLLELALRKIRLKCGCVLLLNEKTGELEFEPRAVKGKSLSIIPEKLSLEEKSLASIVIRTNTYYLCNNTEKEPNYYPLFQGVQSSLVVPITFQERSIGVIAIESETMNEFKMEDVHIITALAKEATMFIRRAQLFAETAKKGYGIMILGTSSEWKDVEKRIENASRTDATVLLRGESGTGKELLAHAIHFNSPRKDLPFITVNCAAIPSELLESELFGHVKGAFTGAYYNKTGEFEKAEGGTIFLDEVGDLPMLLQVKLLRTLQSGEIRPVGSNKVAKRVNVRVIAATSRDLEAMVRKSEFRMDMYYRLNVVPIRVPSLRNYRKDIPLLVKNFIKDANSNYKTSIRNIDPEAMKALMQYNYPGNVRQLRNFINQAAIMSESESITIDDLPEELLTKEKVVDEPVYEDIKDFSSYIEEKEKTVENFTRNYFSSLLKMTSGNVMKSARIAGISRVALYKIINKYDLG